MRPFQSAASHTPFLTIRYIRVQERLCLFNQTKLRQRYRRDAIPNRCWNLFAAKAQMPFLIGDGDRSLARWNLVDDKIRILAGRILKYHFITLFVGGLIEI